jgi:hypothetical protein
VHIVISTNTVYINVNYDHSFQLLNVDNNDSDLRL